MSNGLDPDQDQHSVGPDLGPNCLQRLLTATIPGPVAGTRSAVGNMSGNRSQSDFGSRGCEFNPSLVPYFRGDWS